MPLELGIWRIDGGLVPIHFSALPLESRLEDVLASDLSVLDPGLLLVGRQITTAFGGFVDLLAIDEEGDLVVVELKRDRTPREVVGQVLDYGSWAEGLTYEDVAALFADNNGGEDFEAAFAERFGAGPPEAVNTSHRLIVVAAKLDPSTERIIGYLSDTYGVPVNAVFFRYFEENGHEYLARTWLIDPSEAEARPGPVRATKAKKQEPWNGTDFYVSVGEGPHRTWEDFRRYGFVSAGEGKWASQRMRALRPGHRVSAHIPGTGYVGVGTVTAEARPSRDVTVEVNGQTVPLHDVPLEALRMREHSDNDDLCEWVVSVEWDQARPASEAVWETGMFANQNPACKLRNRFTLDRLAEAFDLDG
ncbi:endonuclease NucS domain-containing protein [Rubrivirga marina]|uniref:Recombinase RecB n=1 Tax=Rubrivirga marina TaxID=1196024 RepID=A0A271IVR5_9BACT|nr:endonuclease NucS domain-containing protein [Rubrivirga marina]PAP75292.1 recombinase RecB [Rubrivirga marina]